MPVKLNTKRFYVCPKCGSNDIESDEFEYNDEDGWKDFRCECGFKWSEVYKFAYNEDENGFRINQYGNKVHFDPYTGEFGEFLVLDL